jgi:hypothetical protein
MKIDWAESIAAGFIASLIWAIFSYSWKRWGERGATMIRETIRQYREIDKPLFSFFATILISSLLFSLFSIYIFYAQPSWRFVTFPSIKVYEHFDHIYKTHKEKLGQAKEDAKVAKMANYQYCEYAQVLWINDLNRHFILLDNNSWRVVAEKTFPLPGDKSYLESYRHKEFPECLSSKGLEPPLGGLFYIMKGNPEMHKLIGCKQWGCQNPFPIHYQRFEHGWIFGTIPINTEDRKEGNVYALIESPTIGGTNELYWEKTQELSPDCKRW